MQQVFFGRTGMRVSALGLGTMSFGGDADETTAAALYRCAREAGVTLFDCADVYNDGRAEQLLGRFAASERDELVITTKAYFPTGGPNARGGSRYHLTRTVEASLRRLGTDRIDVFFLHRFDDVTPLEESLREIERCVCAGKILYPAVSNFSAWQTAKAVGIAERRGWAAVACVQPMYNLCKRQAESEILPYCEAEQLACTPYNPLGGGILSGKYGMEKRPDSGRLLEVPMYATRYLDPTNYAVAERFTAYAAERQLDPVALAIAWVASHPAVTAPLLGARNVEQLRGGLAAADLSITPQMRSEIDELSRGPAPATDRNEEVTAHNYGDR